MNNKKGFTLVELLAVIAILSLLVILAVPNVIKIYNNAKEESNKRSVSGVVKAAEYYVLSNEFLSANKIEDYENIYSKLTFDGKKPDNAEVYVDKNKKIKAAMSYDNRCYYKNADSDEIFSVKLKTNEECSVSGRITKRECFSFSTKEDGSLGISGYSCTKGNNKITDIIIPSEIDGKKVTVLDTYSFNAKGITSVVLPDTLEVIGIGAFMNDKLTSIEIPKSVKEIKGYPFYGNKLTYVNIPENVETIGYMGFAHNQINKIDITNKTYIDTGAFNDNLLPDDESLFYKLNKDGTYDYTILVSYGGQNKNVVIPDGIKIINSNAFNECHLQSVVIPNSVNTIYAYAFKSNDLTTVDIPDSVKYIGALAFGNNKLTSYTGAKNVSSMSGVVFNGNQLPNEQAFLYARNKDASINYSTLLGYGGQIRNDVVLPETITKLSYAVFQLNSITKLTLTNPNLVISSTDLTSAFSSSGATIVNNTGNVYNWATLLNNSSCTSCEYGCQCGKIIITKDE